MKMRILDKSDIKVSEIGLGTWAIGGPYWTEGEPTGWSGPLSEKDILTAFKYAIDSGVNHIDTADVYGYGRSERLIGKALGKDRGKIILATKIGFAATTAEHVYDPINIRKQCEQSLRNLKTDYIDIYYFHHCDFGPNNVYLDGAINTFHELKKEGKIRLIGLSGYSEEELINKAMRIKPSVIQSWADIEHDEFIKPESKLTKFMRENHISFIAMMPFGQGRLLGKFDPNNPPVFGEGDNRIDNDFFSAESLKDLYPRIQKLKERFGNDVSYLAWVALEFILSHQIVASVIPGFRNLEQVKSNLKNSWKKISKDDLDFIFEVFPRSEMKPHPWAE